MEVKWVLNDVVELLNHLLLNSFLYVYMEDNKMGLLVDPLCVGFAVTCNQKNSN